VEPAPEPQLIQGFKELLVADASNEGVRLKYYVLKGPQPLPLGAKYSLSLTALAVHLEEVWVFDHLEEVA
jgi:hypothetical protein